MTDSNLTQLTYVKEDAWGSTPITPRMRKVRMTGEGIRFDYQSVTSNEIRADRQRTDSINVSATAQGPINIELSFGGHDDFLAAALMGTWLKTAEKDNDGVADSKITGVTGSSSTIAVDAAGTTFVANHLVKTTGFTATSNNGLMVVGSSTGTTVVIAGTPGLVDDTAPAAAARMKAVGFQAASDDVTATSTGLVSTLLDFTTFGLYAGQWLKIGGTSTAYRFATAANNNWAQIVSVSAHVISLTNRPPGWSADIGTGKGIRVFFGDLLRNGVVPWSFTFEKGFLGQATPNYLGFPGAMVNGFSLSIAPGAIVTGNFTFMGKGATAPVTSSLDATPEESYAGEVLNAVDDVGRIAEGGVTVTGPNYIQGFTVAVSNNLRERRAVSVFGLVGVGIGDLDVTGTLNTYFGDAVEYNKIVNNTSTSISLPIGKNNQGYVITLPRLKLLPGSPVASGRNTDVILDAKYQALRDPLSNSTIQFDRMEYYEV